MRLRRCGSVVWIGGGCVEWWVLWEPIPTEMLVAIGVGERSHVSLVCVGGVFEVGINSSAASLSVIAGGAVVVTHCLNS